MNLNFMLKVECKDSIYQEALKNKQTIQQYAMNDVIRTAILANKFKLLGVMDDEDLFVQINIDLYGVLKVVGGVTLITKSAHVTKTRTLILVDEGASYLLFQLDGHKAYFNGGFNGTELERFLSIKPGGSFRYYKRHYVKLSMSEIQQLVNPNIVYFYDTNEGLGNPRKSS